MKLGKIRILILIVLLIGCILLLRKGLPWIIMGTSQIKMPERTITEDYFTNREIFKNITEYSQSVPGDVSMRSVDDHLSVVNVGFSKNHPIVLKDSELVDDARTILFKLQFDSIDEMGNAIYFLKKSGIQFEQGIVYSKDGKKPDWPNIEKLTPIEDNWYYYESS